MIVIFGGTGTLGHALARRFENFNNIVIISRCELKQKKMQAKYPQFRYIVGDVRDNHWKHMIKPTVVYNLAAIKHVDTAEFNVEFCFDVNTNGTINTCKWAKEHGAKYILSSTDKAVLPINAYGASKMMAEKFTLANGGLVYSWGNVANSRGSVIGLFKDTLLKEKKVYITDKTMTRFFINIDDAAEFMVDNIYKSSGKYIPEMGAARIVDVARAVARYLKIDLFEIEETGIRPGEKYHEVLISDHDYCLRSDDPSIHYGEEVLYKLIARSLDET